MLQQKKHFVGFKILKMCTILVAGDKAEGNDYQIFGQSKEIWRKLTIVATS